MARARKVSTDSVKKFVALAEEYISEVHYLTHTAQQNGFDELPTEAEVLALVQLGSSLVEFGAFMLHRRAIEAERSDLLRRLAQQERNPTDG